MTLSRRQIPERVSELLGGRPVRWAPPQIAVGDYDGRERTLEVFLADAPHQRALLRRLQPHRKALHESAGGPIVIIFHTSRETLRLHSEVADALDVIQFDLTRLFPFVHAKRRDDSADALEIQVGRRSFVIKYDESQGFLVCQVVGQIVQEAPELQFDDGNDAISAARDLVLRTVRVDALADPVARQKLEAA